MSTTTTARPRRTRAAAPAPVAPPEKAPTSRGLTKAGYRRREFLRTILNDAAARLDKLDVPALGTPGNSKIGTAGRHGLALVYSGLAWHDCPGRTEACSRICYAEGIRYLDAAAKRRGARHLYSYLARNRPALLREILTAEIQHHAHRARMRSLRAVVRIHESGDFINPAHVAVWIEIARAFPDVAFWFYTRSHKGGALLSHALATLASLPNVHGRASHDPEVIPDDLGAGSLMPAAIVSGSQRAGRARKGEAHIPGAVNCPEQMTRGALQCVDCGLCWHAFRPAIRFWQH